MPSTINAPGFWRIPDDVIAPKDAAIPALPYGSYDKSFYPQGTPRSVSNSAHPSDPSGRGPPSSPEEHYRDTMNDVGVEVRGGALTRNIEPNAPQPDPVLLNAMREWLMSNQPFPKRPR